MTSTPSRAQTDVDRLADDFVIRSTQLDPILATSIGVTGHDHELTDLSPDGYERQIQARRDVLAQLRTAEQVDDEDAVTVAAMTESLGLEVELHEANELLGSLNNIASPLQELRMVFDLMPTASPEDWENIGARLNGLPEAITGYVESLREAARRGRVKSEAKRA